MLESDIFYKNCEWDYKINNRLSKCLSNRLNTNGNMAFITRASEREIIKRIATIAEISNIFHPVSINDTNQIFLRKAKKVFNLK